MIVLAIVLLVLAAALTLFGALSWARKLPGNSVIGLRIPEVRRSEDAWRAAHATAGPIWTFGGVALLFGALLAFAGGWMWVFTVVTVLIALVALSLGANAGARAASLIDVSEDTDSGCGENCNCGSPAPAPSVDVTALRRAASEADRN